MRRLPLLLCSSLLWTGGAYLPAVAADETDPGLRGEQWAQQARTSARLGDMDAAIHAWAEALLHDPANVGYRVSLAREQLRAGQQAQARDTLEALLQSSPRYAPALHLQAELAALETRWPDVLTSLERIAPTQKTPAMEDLARRARVNIAIDTAKQLAERQQQLQARLVLRDAEEQAGDLADLIGALAFAYLDIGVPNDGLWLLHDRMPPDPDKALGLRLEQAGFLLKTGDEIGFNVALDRLARMPMGTRHHAHYEELRYLQMIRDGEALRERGDLPAADRKLAAAVAKYPDDARGLSALARLRVAQKRPAEASTLYQTLLAQDSQNPDLLRGAAWAAAQTGDKPAARRLANRAVVTAPQDTALQHDMAALEQAVGVPAKQAWKPDIQVTAGAFTRQREGTPGTRQLSAIELPVEAQVPVASGQLAVTVTPVYLEAGDFSPGHTVASRFGGGPLLSLDASNTYLVSPRGGNQYSRYARGIGAALAYRIGGLSADIGVSPDGFLFRQVIGGLRYEDTLGEREALWYSATLQRRSVTDSVLSWGGSFDPRGGGAWGGVVRTGGLLQANYDFGAFSVNGYGGYDVYEGERVYDNHRLQTGVTFQLPALRTQRHLLSAGLGASLMMYDNNQNYFTWGHGGYFSPQRYWWTGVPVQWAWRGERLSYRLNASLGYQSIAEDAADYFPGNSALQDQAAVVMLTPAATAAGFRGTPVYAAKDVSGVAYNVRAAAEYAMSTRYALGFSAGLDNAADYSQWEAGLYLRYRLTPDAQPPALPFTPFGSPHAR